MRERGAIADALNDFFTEIGTNITNSVPKVDRDALSYIPDNDDIPNFDIGDTGQIHFIDIVNTFESKASTDIDKISMKLI